ncbi:zinc finger protein [Saccharopolyspora sp. NPDC049426]|uniref:zinc finger protein n=1 Tax=Saccharopolyspora sp. NPDC049426 TaxID=3155652 RepID=UPI003417A9D2
MIAGTVSIMQAIQAMVNAPSGDPAGYSPGWVRLVPSTGCRTVGNCLNCLRLLAKGGIVNRMEESDEYAYRPHPFSWIPAEGYRHATAGKRPAGGWRNGEVVGTLCGVEGLAASLGTAAWLWETCSECDVRAHELAAKPVVGAT